MTRKNTHFDGSRIAPLFPLPNCVLFPSVSTLLNVFEPRYRQMTAEVLDGTRMFVLVLLQPGWESDYEGSPPIHPIGCLARIVAEKRLPDGRYHLLVIGGPRVRILEEIHSNPYRKARIEILPDPEIGPDWSSNRVQHLFRQFESLFCLHPDTLSSLSFDPTDTPARFCDKIVFALQIDPQQKQALLAEPNVKLRIDTTSKLLGRLLPDRTG